MTSIDDSNTTPASTPPGFWFGEIESRLRERLRDALAEQDLRRGGWRILHSLADAPATAAELAERMPRGRRGGRGHGRDDHHGRAGHHGFGGHQGHDDRHGGSDDHGHDHDHDHGHGDGHSHGDHHARTQHEPADARDHHPTDHPHADSARIHRPDLHGEHDRRGRDGLPPREFRGHRPERFAHAPGAWSYSRETWRSEGVSAAEQCRHPHHHGASAADAHGGHSPEHREAAFERGFERGFQSGVASTASPGPFGGPFGPGFGGPFGMPDRGPHRGFGHHGRPGHHRHAHHGHSAADRRTGRVLADFTERGWVWFDGDRATLTDEGRAAHDVAFARVREVREALAAGIPADDYATTLSTLEAMARNLGWEPAERSEAAEGVGAEEGAKEADDEKAGTRAADADDAAES